MRTARPPREAFRACVLKPQATGLGGALVSARTKGIITVVAEWPSLEGPHWGTGPRRNILLCPELVARIEAAGDSVPSRPVRPSVFRVGRDGLLP